MVGTDDLDIPAAPNASVLELQKEELFVSVNEVEGDTVKVTTSTSCKTVLVNEVLRHTTVDVKRVPINLYVEAVPPVREEDGVTIMSVVEEVLVVERRLLLREEIHVRRVAETTRHVENVVLRTQTPVVTRTPPSNAGSGSEGDKATSSQDQFCNIEGT